MKKYYCSKTSVIEKNAKIGDGTKIWYFSHIMQDCKIGKNCNIGQNVCISPNVTIGDNVKIQKSLQGNIPNSIYEIRKYLYNNIIVELYYMINNYQYKSLIYKQIQIMIICMNNIQCISITGNLCFIMIKRSTAVIYNFSNSFISCYNSFNSI